MCQLTSVTNPMRFKPIKAKSVGFTLVEILVVMVILAIIVSTIAVSASPNPATQARLETERLTALFALAQEEAQLRGKTLGWEMTTLQADRVGYRFLERQGRSWQALTGIDALRPRVWPLATIIQLSQAGRSVTQLEFAAIGLSQPFQLRLQQAETISVIQGDGLTAPRWQASPPVMAGL